MPGKVRRIVTAVNDKGRSYILSDQEFPSGEVDPVQGARVGLWITDRPRPSNRGTHDPVPGGVIFKTPPEHRAGTVIRISDVPPDGIRHVDQAEMNRRGAQT